jgi:UDP-GlcNAc3NAcA epimerase
MKMPEEINRILTDRISSKLFCPSQMAIENLKKEGFDSFECEIYDSGDVMYDGALFYKNLAVKPKYEIESNFILCTIHRAENTDDIDRIRAIFEALKTISKDKEIILPLHPRTKGILKKLSIDTKTITIIDPVGYLEMVWLIDHCSLVMSDSGGLQKEAYFFKKPCITLRDETEWVELIDGGYNVLAGADKEKILDCYKNFSFSSDFSLNLFGDGMASQKIIREMLG